ncbi:hypothetical protein SDJN03_29666, partial [Cucurbita argyrosperma subsp. sororia]
MVRKICALMVSDYVTTRCDVSSRRPVPPAVDYFVPCQQRRVKDSTFLALKTLKLRLGVPDFTRFYLSFWEKLNNLPARVRILIWREVGF